MSNLVLGRIGLPIVGIDRFSLLARSYTIEIHTVFNNAVNQLPLGHAIKSRLESDMRVRSLIGKTISHGSGSSTLRDAVQLAQWWLWRANNVGIETADRDLENFLESDQIEANAVLWVYGLSCQSPVDVAADVQLVNIDDIQNSLAKESFLRSTLPFASAVGSPAPAAALVTSYLVNKVASNPTEPDFGFNENMRSSVAVQTKLQTLVTILNCLPGVCCVPAFATSQLPPPVPLGPFAGSGGGHRIFDVLPRRTTYLAEGQETLITSLLLKYEGQPQQTKDRLQLALFRLAQAKGRMDDNDRALDLGIALEMLLLNNEHNGQELPGQLSLHFRLRGSWLVGIDAGERRRIYQDLGKVYSLRSQLAHNGYSDELNKMNPEKRQSLFSRHTNIAERIFQKLIIDGSPSDWSSVILGGD